MRVASVIVVSSLFVYLMAWASAPEGERNLPKKDRGVAKKATPLVKGDAMTQDLEDIKSANDELIDRTILLHQVILETDYGRSTSSGKSHDRRDRGNCEAPADCEPNPEPDRTDRGAEGSTSCPG
jgi:hypothetical protein